MKINLKLGNEVIQEIGELVKEDWFKNTDAQNFVVTLSQQLSDDEGILMLHNFRDSLTVTIDQEHVVNFVSRLEELSKDHNRSEWHVRRQVLLQTARYFQDEHVNGVLTELEDHDVLSTVETDDVEKAYDVLLTALINHEEPKKEIVVNNIIRDTQMSPNEASQFVEDVGHCYSSDKVHKRRVDWVELPATIDDVNYNYNK